MNALEIITEVEKNYSEWIEMMDNPHEFIVGILANKIVKLEGHIQYLERRYVK